MGVPADQLRTDMIFQIGRHRQLAPVKRGVTDTGNALVGSDLQRDKIPAWAGHKYLCVNNLHNVFILFARVIILDGKYAMN